MVKKSWWRLPTKAKVAIGYKSGEGFLASQFVVANGDQLEIRLENKELKYWINNEKKIVGETKQYAVEENSHGKYIVKVVWRALPIVTNLADLVVNLATA